VKLPTGEDVHEWLSPQPSVEAPSILADPFAEFDISEPAISNSYLPKDPYHFPQKRSEPRVPGAPPFPAHPGRVTNGDTHSITWGSNPPRPHYLSPTRVRQVRRDSTLERFSVDPGLDSGYSTGHNSKTGSPSMMDTATEEWPASNTSDYSSGWGVRSFNMPSIPDLTSEDKSTLVGLGWRGSGPSSGTSFWSKLFNWRWKSAPPKATWPKMNE
jgi:hypothetical protein